MNAQISSSPAGDGRSSVPGKLFFAYGIRIAALSVMAVLAGQVSHAQTANTLPSGGQIVSGSGRIDQTDSKMTVTQTSDRMIAQWGSFNIGQSASVQFVQPGKSSVALNRIFDVNPSQILGSLTANGQVFLINQAGVYFGSNATVNVGGLVASSLDIADADFLAGRYHFSGDRGKVVNQGAIKVGSGGVVALLSPSVENDGSISAEQGSVALAAGKKVNLDFGGDGLISLSVEESAVEAQVTNQGLIKADGGVVIMSARAADALANTAVNNAGIVEANTISNVNGRILLDGGDEGVVVNTGTLQAAGDNPGEKGGSVVVTGDKVGLFGTAVVDVSGDAGGGTALIGGGFQGKVSSVANATQTLVDTSASIKADAGTSGNGGQVVLWSDDLTRFHGSVSARGGNLAGAGGSVEVSSKNTLDFTGNIDAAAPHGTAGTLLLDPLSITIASGGADSVSPNPLTFATNSATAYTIAPSTITAITNTGTAVTLQANSDITVNSSIVSSNGGGSGGAITLTAGRSIGVNADIVSDNGNITLAVNNTGATSAVGGTANFTNTGHIDAGSGDITLTFGNENTIGTISTGFMSARNVTINAAKTTLGGALVLGQSVVDKYLKVYSGGTDITNPSGTVVNIGITADPGQTTLDASNAGNTVFGNITLNNSATNLNEVLANGNNFTLVDTNAVQLGTSTVRGNLNVTTYGPIGNTGVVNVTGTTTLTANNGGFGTTSSYINLSGYSNHFAGTFTATAADYINVQDAGAMILGVITSGNYLTLTTGGSITGHSTITVPDSTVITAGNSTTQYDVTLDGAGNDFGSSNGSGSGNYSTNLYQVSFPYAKNVTLVDSNSFEFGTSNITGNLALTAGGDIYQYYYRYYNYAPITVAGTTTFTANHASSPINLYLGPDDPFYSGYPGSANSLVGTVTLARNNTNTGFTNIQLRNTSSSASVLAGLTSVGTLNNVYLTYNNAPAVTLPGMTLTGSLKVYAPSVTGTASTPANIISQTGPIVVAGDSIFQAGSTGDVILSDSGNDFSRITVISARDATIRDSNAIVLYGNSGSSYEPFSVSRNLTVTAAGTITDSSVSDSSAPLLVTGGTLTMNAVSNDTLTKYNITLDGSYNRFSTISVPAANNVTIYQYYGNLAIGNSTVAGTFSIINNNTGYALSQVASSTITTGSTTTFSNWDSISLGSSTEPNNVFGNLAINRGNVTLRENDAITQASAWSLWGYSANLTTTGSQAITLTQSGNQFSALTLTQAGADTTTAGSGAVSVTTNYPMGQGSAWTTHGLTTINETGGYDISLTNSGNVFGPLKVTGNGSTYLYAKDWTDSASTAHNAITDVGSAGAWSTGYTDLRAYNSAASATSGTINLLNTSNILGDLTLYGGTVTITNNAAITDYASGTGYSSQAWHTSGTTTLDSRGYAIVLDNYSNVIGPIAIVGTSGGTHPSSVTITEADNIDQASAWTIGTAPVTLDSRSYAINLTQTGNVLGAITITTTPSSNVVPTSVSITEDDAITQAQAWQLKPNTGTTSPVTLVTTSGQAISLGSSDNLLGNLIVTQNGAGTGAVSIREIDTAGITQAGAWTTRGTTTLDTNAVINLPNASNVLGPITVNGAYTPTSVTITENDDITQASAWSVNTAPVALNAGSHQILLTNSGNILGNIALSGSPSLVSLRENDAITQNTAWSLGTSPVTLATSNDQAITLNQNNVLGGLTITQYNTGATSFGAVLVTEADTNGITESGAWTTHGVTTLNAGTGNPIVLTQTGNVLANLAISGAPSAVSVTENHAITQDSVWSIGTAPVALVTTGDQQIDFSQFNNVLGNLTVTQNGNGVGASSVAIKENDAITQGSTAWTVHGALKLDATTNSITLANKDNIFGPLQVLGGTGASKSVSLYAKDWLDGNSVSHAAITDVGAAGPWTVGPVVLYAYDATGTTQGGGQINLTQANNFGAIDLKGSTVTVTAAGAITDGSVGWTTTGTTTLNTTSNVITLDNTANVLGPIALSGTPTGVTITENDDITQASAWVYPTIPFTLNAQTHNVLLTQASNQLGDLIVTGANATVVEAHAITDAGAWTVPGLTTLTAGSNAITLDTAGGNFGTLKIVSASAADVTDTNAIVLDDVAVTNTFTLTAGGAMTQVSGKAVTASSLRLLGAGYATLTNTGNNVANLAAGFSGGDLQYTDTNDFVIANIGGTSGISIGGHNVTLTSVNGTITGFSNTTISSASTSLTVSTGTALTLPQMTINGAQTYTASTVSGTGVTLTGDITSNGAGAITFNSPVTLSSNDWAVRSSNSPIVFNSTVAGGTNILTVNAGTSTIDFYGAVSGLGATSDATAALVITAGGAGTVFHSTLGANNGLSVAGPVTFMDDVTFANGNAGSVFTGLVTFAKAGGMTLSGYDTMRFSGGVVLQNGPATINTNNSALTFENANTVSGPYALTLNSGTATLTGLDHIGSNITNLTVTAYAPTIPAGGLSIAGPQSYTATSGTSIHLGGNVTGTAAGAILFNSPVVLDTDSTVTSSNSAITFMSTLEGSHDLVLSSGSGLKTITGKAGLVYQIGDGVGAAITLQGSGATSFGDTVGTRSGIVAAGPVTFSGDVTMANGDTGSAFTGLVTTGAVTISGYDGLAFNGGLTLTGNTSLISNGSNTSFGAAVSGPYTLTVNALSGGAGTVTGLSNIGTNLTSLTLTGQTLSLPSGGLAVSGPMSFTAAGGITLNGAVGSASTPATGQIDFNGPVSLATGAITVTTANAPINFANTVNGAQSLTVNAGTGTTTFTGSVGGTTPLGSLTTTGTAALNGATVRTSGAQQYNNAVVLGANSTLTASALTFSGTLNGGYTLLANVSGATTFNGVVGGSTPLTSITTDAAGSVVFGTTAITATGAQTYNELITLNADTTLTGSTIKLLGGADGAHTLTLSDAGATTLGTLGGTTPLTSLSVTATGITLNGNITTDGNATFTGGTTLGGDVVVSTGTGVGDITFSGVASTINGAHNLTLAAGSGNVVLGGIVGSLIPLGVVDISGYDLTVPVINSTGAQTYNALNNLTLSQSRTSSVPYSFTADSDGDGSGSFILPTGVTLVMIDQPVTIHAADIDLQGTSTISSGAGLITLAPSNNRNLIIGGSDATAMSLSTSELSRISTSGGLTAKTSGTGWIKVAGVSAANSQNISGQTYLDAQGSGDVSFLTGASTFNALKVESGSGMINLGQNVTTTNDPITFVSPVTATGTVTVSSGGSSIDFQNTLAASNPITLATGGGALTLGGNVTGTSTVTVSLGGGTVTGLDKLQSTLTGLTLSNTASVTLPAISINGPQVYNGPVSLGGNLTGIGLSFNDTVAVGANNLVLNSGTGTTAFVKALSASTNNLTVTGDEIDFSAAMTGTGNLTLQPSTSSVGVLVGGSSSTASLDLTASDLANLPNNLASLTIGRTTGTGTLAIAGATNFGTVPVTLNGVGGISQSAALTSGGLTLNSNGSIVLSNTANSLGAIAISGTPTSVSLADSTPLTQSSAWVLGSAPVTLNAGSNDITLTQSGNTFGNLSLTGGAVQITESADTTFAASNVSALTAVSTGAISTVGTVTVSGAATFKTLNDAGKSVTLDHGSTFGSLIIQTRNGADTADVAGAISLAPAASTVLKTIATLGNVSITAPASGTVSQDASSVIKSAGLELIGSGDFDLSAGTNTVTTLAGSAGNISFASAGGYAIGTVNTAGLTATGTITLSSGGTVTQSQPVTASALRLLGAGSTYTLTNSGNEISTLAGSAGTVSFRDDTGFVIGAVSGTNGLTATGNVTLSTTGAVTQTQALASSGLELLGTGSTYTLDNTGNDISTLAGSVGSMRLTDNNGFTVGSVNTTGLTATGSVVFTSTATVNQTQNISAAQLGLLGTGGAYTFTRDGNSIGIFAANTGSLVLHSSGGLVIGQVNPTGIVTTGDVTIVSDGAVTQTQPLIIGGNLSVTTTHAAGNVTIDNSAATATVTGDSLVGGNYSLIATGQNVTQSPGTNIQVAGNLTITSSSATLDGAANLVGGTTSLPGTNSTLRQSGVITLGDLSITGNYTVISTATNRSFSSGAIGGTAVDLSNSANAVHGTISVTTVAPSITSGAPVQTGINQSAGTKVNITGNASFTAEPSAAGSLGVVLANTGNTFGSVRASGNVIDILDSSTASVIAGLNGTTSTNFVATGPITQTGAILTPTLTLTSGGAATLTNASNQVATLTLDASGSIAYTDTDGFAVAGINAHGNTLALVAGGTGAITQTGAMQNVTALSVTSGGAATLDNAGNTLGSLASVTSGGALYVRDSSGGLTISGAVQATTGDITLRTSGDLTMGSGSTVTATAGNLNVSTEGAGNFINNATAGAGVFTVGSGNRWLVYSKTPDLMGTNHTVKGGLTSSFRLYGTTFTSKAPGSVTETGNGFIYADTPSSSLTISPTITGTASHTYGDTPTATLGYTITGGLADSEDSIANIAITGTATFDIIGAATYHALSNAMNADSYSVKFTGGLSSGYTLVADTNGVAYTVNKAPLTYTATSASRNYGDTNPAFSGSITGFKLSQGVADLGGTVSWTSTADATTSVGHYAITGSGYTSNNYSFSQAAGNATALEVTARPITLKADDQNRTYGNANPTTGTYTITSGNLVNSDALSASLSVSSPATATSNVGGYALTPSSAAFTTGAASNYAITYTDGTLHVTTRPITLTANDQSRYYGSANPTTGGFAITSGSLANSDALNTSVSVSSPATATDHAGSTTALTPSSASFSSGLATNYAISYADGTLTIAQRPITITASNQNRTYGDANPNTGGFTVSGSGLANTDAVDASLGVSSPATATSNVGGYALTPSGLVFTSGLASDYAVTYADGTLNVTARPITLKADDQNRTYGNANPTTGTYTITSGNLVNSDALDATLSVSSPATATSNVGGYALTPSAANFTTGAASNYAITYTDGTLNVTARPITLTANDQSRYYGSANPTTGGFAITSGSLANSDALNTSVSVSSLATATDHAGSTAALTPSGASFSSGLATNYSISYADGTLTITQRPITITASNQNRTYGDANPNTGGFTVNGSGLANTDAVDASLGVSSPATATSNVGGYALTPSGLVFTSGLSSDYAITYADGTLNVTARPITLKADDQNRTYGNANPTTGTYTITSGNLVNSDALDATLSVSSPATATSNVGGYALTPSSAAFTTGAASNYAITYADGTLNVTARPITLTANDQSRVYGDANPTAGTYAITSGNLVNGDALNASLTVSSPATATSNVGGYALTPSDAVFSSGLISNYAVTYADGTLNVTQRPLTLTLDNQSRVYGDANPATGTYVVGGSGLVNTDALDAALPVTSPATLASNVGDYALQHGTVAFTSGSAGNYAISYVDSTLTVTTRPITITPNSQSRTYGDENPTSGGFTVGGRGLANSDALTTAVSVSSPATATSNVGDYALSSGLVGFTSGTASNYAVTYADGSLTVTPAVLTFTADPASRMYGNANPSFSGSISGFKNGESLASATTGTLDFTSPTDVTSNAGGQPINGGGLTANYGNYTFAQAAGNATALTITPRPLLVTAVDFNRYYGDANPAIMPVTTTGLVNGDTVAGSGAVTSATQASYIGAYAITPNSTTFSTGLAGNYTISYVGGTMTVLPRPLTVTPESVSRVYGEANPVYGVVLADNLANGDTLGVSLLSSAATAGSNVGTYSLASGSAAFIKGASINYAITYAPGTLTVMVRPVTITADSQTKVYGSSDPTLSYKVESPTAGRGLLSGQSLLGGLVRAAGETVDGGPYAIGVGSLASSNPNYAISFTGSSLTITPAVLTYTATTATAASSINLPPLGGSVLGLVNGDTLSSATSGSLLWTTDANATSAPGSYSITGSGLTANHGDYTFVQAAGNANALFIVAGPSTVERPVIPEPNLNEVGTTDSGVETSVRAGPAGSASFASTVTAATEAIVNALPAAQGVLTQFVSLPVDNGPVTFAGASLLPTESGAAAGPVSFANADSFAVAIFTGEMVERAHPVSGLRIPLYLSSAGTDIVVGNYAVTETGNVLSMVLAGDQQSSVLPTMLGGTKTGVYRLPSVVAGQEQVTVKFSENGVLTVEISADFVEARGLKQAALAGMVAARAQLQIDLNDVTVIKVIPKKTSR